VSTDAADQTAALNRIADALFTQAKVSRLSLRVAQDMCAMQKANLATTKALEAALTGAVRPDV
jgi:hypothetical protein